MQERAIASHRIARPLLVVIHMINIIRHTTINKLIKNYKENMHVLGAIAGERERESAGWRE